MQILYRLLAAKRRIIGVQQRKGNAKKVLKGMFVMKKYTKKHARECVEAYAHLTGWFDGSIAQRDMYEILRYRMQFGEPETRVIIAALVMAGAKFKIAE